MSDWLEKLKAGDRVAVPFGFGDDLTIATIDRATATQLVIGGTKYKRSNGDQIGAGRWSISRLHELTPEVNERIKRRRLIEKCRGFNWADADMELLQKVAALLVPPVVQREGE